MKKPIDLDKPVYKYKVLMSELIGYYITIAASSPEEAQHYANDTQMRKNYTKSDIMVVETTPVSAELIVKQEI
tara:strand:+ start:44 stop:262 length:219 start_codon:yes stop_codon:yes gene_type:complete